MLSYARAIVQEVEDGAAQQTPAAIYSKLRKLGLDDFGELLMLAPHPDYPKLSAHLPAMASTLVQDQWTGQNGYALLRQTSAFVRSVSYNYTHITGRSLSDATMLDYGCGYGRIARLMYYFSDPQNVIGVDPWDRSIDECHTANMGPYFRQSDYLPKTLPVDNLSFDICYAFSVFTHLSKRAADLALTVIRRYMKPGALLCLTIRPVEYWDYDFSAATPAVRDHAKAEHARTGFAFVPHNRPPVDGEVTYGDTSMSLDWLQENAPGWMMAGIDRSLEDPLQLYVFMQAS